MKLCMDGRVEFSSRKDIVDYINSFSEIECDKDDSWLLEMIMAYNCLKETEIKDDDGYIYISEEGGLDEEYLDDIFAESPINGDEGIRLSVKIGDFEFVKDSFCNAWECENFAALKALPSGYTDDEFYDAVDLYQDSEWSGQYSDCEEYGMISSLLDKKTQCYKLFGIRYRDVRTIDEDISIIASKLVDLGYDGFYTMEYIYESSKGECFRGHRVYGWKEGMKEPWENFSRAELIDSDKAAVYLGESIGWVDPEIVTASGMV